MAKKTCDLCGEPYGKGPGSNKRHLKERHPDLLKEQMTRISHGQKLEPRPSKKAPKARPQERVAVATPEEKQAGVVTAPPAFDWEDAQEQGRGVPTPPAFDWDNMPTEVKIDPVTHVATEEVVEQDGGNGADGHEESITDLFEQFMTMYEARKGHRGDGGQSISVSSAGSRTGGPIPRGPRSTADPNEASAVAFVPKVLMVSSPMLFQCREICVRELGWPADWPIQDWLDTFCFEAMKSWGWIIGPYAKIAREGEKQ